MPTKDSTTLAFTSGSWNRGGHVFCRGKLFARAYAPEFTAQSGEEHRRAEMIADALNEVVNRPWPDGGPSIADVADRPFLGYFEGDDWRELYREVDGRICFADGRPVRTPPVVWKPMPPAPERG